LADFLGVGSSGSSQSLVPRFPSHSQGGGPSGGRRPAVSAPRAPYRL
jgi:hypothetical protein